MIPEVYRSFITDIIEKTNKKVVNWIEEEDDVYSLKTKNATISIGYAIDYDIDHSYYFFNFKNIDNKRSAGFRVTILDDGFKQMEELFELAAASANNIDEELNEFLKDL